MGYEQSSYRLRNSEDSTEIGGFHLFHRFASEFSTFLAKSTDCLEKYKDVRLCGSVQCAVQCKLSVYLKKMVSD